MRKLFHRLVASGKRKQQYAYSVSYQRDVGSSFDPVLEEEAETAEWEEEIDGMFLYAAFTGFSHGHAPLHY